MDTKRKIGLTAATLAMAFGAGHLVQLSADAKAPVAAAEPTGITQLSAKATPDPRPVQATTVLAGSATVARPTPAISALAAPVSAVPKLAATAPAAPVPATPAPASAALAVAAAALPAAPPPAPPHASPPGAALIAAKAGPGDDTVLPPPGSAAPAALAPTLAKATPAAEPAAPPAAVAPAPAPAAAADACLPTLSVTDLPGAVLSVGLVAPCDGGARVVLRHGGLAVTGRLSPGGTLFAALPAMERTGAVSALFADGTRAEGASPVDLSGVRRFAIQWQALDAFQLQVYEDGAAFGAPGHVSAAAPVGAGKLEVLGDATVDLPLLAEVYTWPASEMPVALTVESAVTAATCGRELLGEVVESIGGKVVTTEVTLAMPGCDAVGDFLVLNNLVGQTTLAAAD